MKSLAASEEVPGYFAAVSESNKNAKVFSLPTNIKYLNKAKKLP